MSNYKIASLFCGCGGTDLGIKGGFSFLGKKYKKNSINLVYANDIDPKIAEIYKANFKNEISIKNIREVPSDSLPNFDILLGGFPCQSFSIIAQNPKRLGIKDEKGTLFFEMVRILKEKKPLAFVAENVKGILSANKGQAFPLILKEFEKANYNISFNIVNSYDFGVPQNRYRVLIVGIRKDLKTSFAFPDSGALKIKHHCLKDILEPKVDKKYYFSKKAIKGMERVKEKMNKGRAQNPNKPCNTVGSHLAKVSLNSTDPVLLDKEGFRRFTPREVARIQSFPDDFKLVGSEHTQYLALGNAISPVMFWYISRSLIHQLDLAVKK